MLQPPAYPPDSQKVLANGQGLQKASGLGLKKGKNMPVSTSLAGRPGAEGSGAVLWWLRGRHAGAGLQNQHRDTGTDPGGVGDHVRFEARAGFLLLRVRLITPGSNY